MDLYNATTEVHHTAEHSRFGELLKSAQVSRQQYADWLYAQHEIHRVIDAYLPPAARRLPSLYLDLADLWDTPGDGSEALTELLSPLYDHPESLYTGGMCYVLTGAHLRGGPQNRKPLEAAGFPCRHLRFERNDAQVADAYLKTLREMPQFADGAVKAFRNVLAVMEHLVDVY